MTTFFLALAIISAGLIATLAVDEANCYFARRELRRRRDPAR